MKKTFFLVFLTFAVVFFGCKKKLDDNGLTHEINEFIPDSVINTMISLGLPINTGNTPDELEGTYLVTPFILSNSNVPGDNSGYQFMDLEVTLYDFNRRDLTIKVDYVNGPESGTGLGSFIVGENEKFSVFANFETTAYDSDASMAMVFSGKLDENGITDFYFANFMLDNYGNEFGYWIGNGQGRVVYDSDGFSERTDGAKSNSNVNYATISQKLK
jgi:hypothetical protein